jgi:hypothetical protein
MDKTLVKVTVNRVAPDDMTAAALGAAITLGVPFF